MRLFLLEDDKALALGMEYALRSEGFEVIHVSTIREAKECLAEMKECVDLYILDVMLPDGSGYDFCAVVETESRSRGVDTPPVIFLSAHDNEANIVMGLESGGDDYLTKPFGLRELVARIRSVLRRYRKTRADSESTERLVSGSLVLDLHRLQVSILGEAATPETANIPLTAIEYRLLKLLMESDGRTLTRKHLLDRIWDEKGDYVDDNTLSVHIRHLREKIEDDPTVPQRLVTIRGVGYALRAI